MELLTRHDANISMTNEAAICIGLWLKILDDEKVALTDAKKDLIKKEFQKILIRLDFPKEEIIITLDGINRIICHFTESKNNVIMGLDQMTHELRIIKLNGAAICYKATFNNKTIKEIYLRRKATMGNNKKKLTIDLQRKGIESYCWSLSDDNQNYLRIVIAADALNKFERLENWINMSALEEALQSITFPFVLDTLYRQIYNTLGENIKETYSLTIYHNRNGTVANKLQIQNGELKTYIVAEAEELQYPWNKKDAKRKKVIDDSKN